MAVEREIYGQRESEPQKRRHGNKLSRLIRALSLTTTFWGFSHALPSPGRVVPQHRGSSRLIGGPQWPQSTSKSNCAGCGCPISSSFNIEACFPGIGMPGGVFLPLYWVALLGCYLDGVSQRWSTLQRSSWRGRSWCLITQLHT